MKRISWAMLVVLLLTLVAGSVAAEQRRLMIDRSKFGGTVQIKASTGSGSTPSTVQPVLSSNLNAYSGMIVTGDDGYQSYVIYSKLDIPQTAGGTVDASQACASFRAQDLSLKVIASNKPENLGSMGSCAALHDPCSFRCFTSILALSQYIENIPEGVQLDFFIADALKTRGEEGWRSPRLPLQPAAHESPYGSHELLNMSFNWGTDVDGDFVPDAYDNCNTRKNFDQTENAICEQPSPLRDRHIRIIRPR